MAGSEIETIFAKNRVFAHWAEIVTEYRRLDQATLKGGGLPADTHDVEHRVATLQASEDGGVFYPGEKNWLQSTRRTKWYHRWVNETPLRLITKRPWQRATEIAWDFRDSEAVAWEMETTRPEEWLLIYPEIRHPLVDTSEPLFLLVPGTTSGPNEELFPMLFEILFDLGHYIHLGLTLGKTSSVFADGGWGLSHLGILPPRDVNLHESLEWSFSIMSDYGDAFSYHFNGREFEAVGLG